MKKILLYLLTTFVSCTGAYAQWLAPSYGSTKPTASPSTVRGYQYLDTIAKKAYVWKGTRWDEVPSLVQGGKDGRDGVNGTNGFTPVISIGVTTTLPAGSSATVSQSGTQLNPIFNFGIPQGAQGSGGGGGSTAGLISPDDYGAKHSTQTVQGSKTYDRQALTNCFQSAKGKVVILYGDYYVDSSFYMLKYDDVRVIGNAMIHTTNSNKFDVMTSAAPTDLNDAIKMESRSISMEGVKFQVSGAQTAFRPYASFYTYVQGCKVFGDGRGMAINLEFNLSAYLLDCEANNLLDGFNVSHGGFPSANQDNSQSNYTTLYNCRCFTVSHIGFNILQSYGVKLNSCIVEGNNSIYQAVNFDANLNTNVKDFTINTFHFEQTGGATDAIVNLYTRDAIVYITDFNIKYNTSVAIAATSKTGAQSFGGWVYLDQLTFLPDMNNGSKWFRSNSMFWSFQNSNYLNSTNLTTCWDTAKGVKPCSAQSCGWDAYSLKGLW
jgi:hypothetical protein